MENMGILNPESHMFFKQVIKRNNPDVAGSIMTHLSTNSLLTRELRKFKMQFILI